MALDGVLAHVAGAGRGSFNFRFAQPSRDAQPTSSVFYPTDIFPFTDQPETDPLTGETGGLLDRASSRSRRAEDLFLEYLVRILGTGRLADPHERGCGDDATISPR